jgi:hypothetical protein
MFAKDTIHVVNVSVYPHRPQSVPGIDKQDDNMRRIRDDEKVMYIPCNMQYDSPEWERIFIKGKSCKILFLRLRVDE